MKVQVWGDIVCPWCYIGRHRFESARTELAEPASIEVIYRSFELDPNAPSTSDSNTVDSLAMKYGLSREEAERAVERVVRLAGAEGLEIQLDRARPTNTLDAHRVLQLASLRGVRPTVETRFQRAYFNEGEVLSDPETLLRLSTESGLAEADVRRVLAGQAFTLQVRLDERAARELGATGVPFYLFDGGRTISGAQPTPVFTAALRGGPPL